MTIIDMPYATFTGDERTIQAEIVDVAPHLIATFALHRDMAYPKLWLVSNVETGYRISQSLTSSRRSAIRLAREFLATKTQAELEEQFKKVLAAGFKGPVTKADRARWANRQQYD